MTTGSRQDRRRFHSCVHTLFYALAKRLAAIVVLFRTVDNTLDLKWLIFGLYIQTQTRVGPGFGEIQNI